MSGLTGEQASRSSPRKLPEVGLSPKYQSVANRAWRSSNRMRGARAVDSILGDYVLSVETRDGCCVGQPTMFIVCMRAPAGLCQQDSVHGVVE